MMRDLVGEVYRGELTEDDAYDLFSPPWDDSDHFAEMSRIEVGAYFGLSIKETRAIDRGADFATVGRWREEGWPKQCAWCQQPIDYDESPPWQIHQYNDDEDVIVHMACKPKPARMIPDFSKLVAFSEIKGRNERETVQFRSMAEDCRQHIQEYEWCLRINKSYFGLAIPDVAAVCMFDIDPLIDHVVPRAWRIEKYVWAVAGFVTPAYFSNDTCWYPALTLAAYIDRMDSWVDAIENSKDTNCLFPLCVEPTKSWAEQQKGPVEKLFAFLNVHYPEDVIHPLRFQPEQMT